MTRINAKDSDTNLKLVRSRAAPLDPMFDPASERSAFPRARCFVPAETLM